MRQHLPREYDYAYRGHRVPEWDWALCGESVYATRDLKVARGFGRGGVYILAFDGCVEAHRPWWSVEDDPDYYDEVLLPIRQLVWVKLVIVEGKDVEYPVIDWNPLYVK